MRRGLVVWFLLFIAACSSELPHEAPFDAKAPAEKQARATLSGTVRLEGETDFSQVTLELQNETRTYSVDTDADGVVTITGIVPGAYTLKLRTRYFTAVTETLGIDVGETIDLGVRTLAPLRGRVVGKATLEKIDGDQLVTKGGVALKLTKTASVRAAVTKAPAYRATAKTADLFSVEVVSGFDGEFSFDDVPAGGYELTAASEDTGEQPVGAVTVTGEGDVEVDPIVLRPLTGYFEILGSANGVPSKTYTSTPNVNLQLQQSNAAKVKVAVSSDGTTGGCVLDSVSAEALPANTLRPLTFASEGKKLVCVRFVDEKGKETPTLYGGITYDATPPTLSSVVVNGGASVVANALVTLALSAADTLSGVATYEVNTVNDFTSVSPKPFQPTDVFTLGGTDGVKTVWVRFGDAAGNYALPVSASVLLDTTAPALSGAVSVTKLDGTPLTSGATIAESRIKLVSSVVETSGVLELQITTNGSYAGQPWVAYDPAKPIDLPSGAATISARVRDGAGHIVDLLTAFTLTTDTTPPTGTLVIAPTAVTDPAITVQATGSIDAVGVELAFDPGFVTSLGVFTPGPIAVTLPAGDGVKTVYGRFFDAAGNASSLVGDTVELDTTPPLVVSLAITQSSPTKDNPVDLLYSVSGASEFRVAEGATCSGVRESIGAGTKAFTLSAAEGLKDVRVQFFDAAGNASSCLVRSIYYDPNPPVVGALQINYGQAATSSNVVTLSFPGVSGASKVMVSEDAGFAGADWQGFAATKTFTLSAGNGVKTVYAKVADDAGHVVNLTQQTITLDTTPPESPSIYTAVDVTTQTNVLVTLSAGLVSEMWVTVDDPSFASGGWETYTGLKNVTLSGADGTKTIYAKFKKSTGLETAVVSDTVVLDRAAPTLPSVSVNGGAAVVTSNLVTLSLSAVDAASGVATYKVNTVNDFSAVSPKPFQPTDVFSFAPGDGVKTVWVTIGDKAGLYSTPVSATVVLDTTPPVVNTAPSVTRLDGTSLTTGNTLNDTRIVLTTSVSDASSLQMQVTTNGSYSGTAWVPYEAAKVIDLASGAVSLSARVRDAAGLVTDLVTAFTLTIDATAPTLTFTRTSATPTNDPVVSLALSANETSEAQVSESPGFDGATWFPTGSTTITLTTGDGLRTIYARVRDGAGNVSASKTVLVTLDQTPPQLASFSIAQGTQTNQQTVSLDLSAAGADWMQVAESATCGGSWEAYATSKGWTFGTAVNETKTISVRFKDNAGNLTGCLTRTIAFDNQAPTFTAGKGIVINNDDAFTTSRTISLALNVTGATEVQVSESSTFVGAAWQSAVTSATWTLSAGEGVKTLYLRARDAAGNTTGTQSDAITVDTIAPAFNTTSGPSISAVEAVNLSLSASGATKMRLSELPDFSDTTYVTYNATAPFTLASVEGVHTIYIQLADDAGNESIVRSVIVTLDKSAPSAPVVSVVGGAYTTTAVVSLQILAADATEMLISQYAPMTDATWQPYASLKSFTLAGGDGAKTIYVKVRDGAGNTSAASTANVTQDGTVPSVSLFQAEDAGGNLITQSNSTRFYLHLTATDASPVTVQFNTSNVWAGIPSEAIQTVRAWDAAPPTAPGGENRSVYVRVADAAGNAAVAGPVTVLVDTLGPTSPSIAVAPSLVSSPTVTVTLAANNADNVELSEDISFLSPTVLAYTTSTPYTFLNTSDGAKTLYARYVDVLGNYSGIVVANVTLDQTAPKFPSLAIVQSSPTKVSTVNLTLSAVGADFMSVSENSCLSNWEAYQTAKAYTFGSTVNGTKTIAVRFKDAAGNTSSCVTQTIDFDDQAPQLLVNPFRINYGDAATSNATVTLVSNVVGASEIRVSEDSSLADAAWVPYSATRTFVLSAGNGTKTVYAQYRDTAGNTTAIINDTIVLDTTTVGAPYISIQTDVTSSTTVTVNLGASNIDEMILSDQNDFSTGTGWVAYTGVTTYTFGGADGTKTLFAKFRKSTGAETAVVSDSYILDRIAPSFSQIVVNNGASYTTSNQLTLALTGVDDTSGVQVMQVYEDGNSAVSQAYVPALVFPVSTSQGNKIVWVRFADRAGNFAAPVSASIVLDTVAPVVASFDIEDSAGNPLTISNTARVVVHVVATDANPLQMLVSNRSDFAGSAWQPYQDYLQWDLPLPSLAAGETRTVYAKVRDAAGATVSAGSVSLTLDTIAPSGVAVDIVGTATTSPTVTVNFTYSNADFVEYSTDPGFQISTEIAAVGSTNFTFTGGDGVKTLYARFRDNAYNYSATVVDQITLDTTPPQLASFSIDQGALTNQTTLTLTLSAIEAAEMQVREGATCGGTWESFATTKALPISAAEGTKTIAVRFRDTAGNTTACLTRTTTLDTSPPTYTAGKGVVINGDDAYTTSRMVSLALNVTDATQLLLSENATFAGAAWQPAVTSATWTFGPGEGAKTVYLKARDAAGNESLAQSDSITVDTIAPSFSSVTGPTVSSTEAVVLSVVGSGATKMRLSESADLSAIAYGAFNVSPAFTLGSAEGLHTIYVQLADDAGNESIVRSVNVTLDKSAPNAPVVSVVGGAYTTTANVTLQILADGATEMLVSQYAPMTDATWQPYSQIKAFALAGGDGGKTIFVKVRDGAGNVSAASTASVTLDATAPSVSLFRAEDGGGAVITQSSSTRFYLRLAATDASPLTVQFNTSNLWPGIPSEALQPLRAWDAAPPTLAVGENRNVYARVVDAAGNATVVGPVTVLVDTLGPTAPSLVLAPALVSSPTVTATLSAVGASFVELAEDVSFLAPVVVSYAANTGYTFVNTADGTKTLYARYVDDLGNVSSIVAATVVLDATPPASGSVVIDGGNLYAISVAGTVALTLGAADAVSGLDRMKIANLASGSCATTLAAVASEPFGVSKSWTLVPNGAGIDQVRWVCAAFRDAAGNWSNPVSDAIGYDTAPPAPVGQAIVIDGGAGYATSTQAELTLSANGASEMMVVNGATFGNAIWEPYRSQIAWLLPASAVAVERTVSVKFRDPAGNESPVYADTITLDTEAPGSPAVAINGGAPYATTTTVDLDLLAVGADDVEISNDPYFLVSTTVPYATSYTDWGLAAGDGVRAVFVRYGDDAGNRSSIVSDNVVVDTVAPTGADFTISEAPVTPLLSVFLELTASGATEMQIAEDACGGLWNPYSTNASYAFANKNDGVKTIAVRFRDPAGNMTPCLTRSIILDSTHPYITSMAPRSGYGGNSYTINGINFGVSGGNVYFGGIMRTGGTWSNSTVSNTVPDIAEPGPHPVFVRTSAGKDSQSVSYLVYPRLDSVLPTSQFSLGSIQLHGSSFGATPGNVTVGGVAAAIVGWYPYVVTVTVPGVLNAGTYDVRITAGGLDSPFVKQVRVFPKLDSISPIIGGGGTLITLTGSQFGTNPAVGAVRVGAVDAAIVSWTATQIQATVPAGLHPGPLNVQVIVNGIGTGFKTFTYDGPWLHAQSTVIGAVGDPITFQGTSLGASTGQARLGGVALTTSGWSATTISGTIPAGVAKGSQTFAFETASGVTANALKFHQRGADVWYWPDIVKASASMSTAMVWTGREVILWNGTAPNGPLRYNPVTDTWLVGSSFGAPSAAAAGAAVWTGKEVVFVDPVGRYSPMLDSWIPTASASVGSNRPAVWTGTEVVVGTNAYSPETNTWRSTTANAGQFARAVWTGTHMIFWGSSAPSNVGGVYDPYANSVRPTQPVGAPSARYNFAAVWTGTEFVVWGGRNATVALSDGARYNPETDTWSPMAAAPAGLEALTVNAAWIGGKMFVAGNGYAFYDPSTDTWSPVSAAGAPATGFPVAADDQVVVLDSASLIGARYDTSLDTWTSVSWPVDAVPIGRTEHTSVWTGTELIIWGGDDRLNELNTGARYNPTTHDWLPTNTVGAPVARTLHAAAWLTDCMVVWGGENPSSLNSGGRYYPATDSWLSTTTTGAPTAREEHSMVATAADVIVWGGRNVNTGAHYNPATDVWTATPTAGAPIGRRLHTALWTGDRMLVWGGMSYSSPYNYATNTGGSYIPGTGWSTITTVSAPSARYGHAAVWTGSRMVIWGGASYVNGSYSGDDTVSDGGARYDPVNNVWEAITTTDQPTIVMNAAYAWTGTHLFIHGGRTSEYSSSPTPGYRSTIYSAAALYNPATDTWTAVSSSGAYGSRYNHTAAWNGLDLMLFGGQTSFNSNRLSEFVLYQPY